MVSIAAKVRRLQDAGVIFTILANDIRYKAPSGVLDSIELRLLSQEREEILKYLRAQEAAQLPPLLRSCGLAIPSYVQEMWWHWIDKSISCVIPLVELFPVEPSFAIAAVEEVIATHDVLRWSFREVGEQLQVFINPIETFDVERENLRPGALLNERIREFIGRPLPSDSGWLTRAKVITAPSGSVVVLVANHLVTDETSTEIIKKYLRRRLSKGGSFHKDQSRLKFPQYADFARWQRCWFSTSAQPLCDYWKEWTKIKTSQLTPMSRILSSWRNGSKVRHEFSLPVFAHRAVVSSARQHFTSVFLVYLTIFAVSIAEWSGCGEFLVRSVRDDRTSIELASMVGLLIGADAIFCDVDPKRSFSENLRAIEAEYMASVAARIPSLPAFPPYMVKHEEDWENLSEMIGVQVNYSEHRSAGVAPTGEDGSWPPDVSRSRAEIWPHRVSAINLQVVNNGITLSGSVSLHEGLLSESEQFSLVSTFFRTFAECVLSSS